MPNVQPEPLVVIKPAPYNAESSMGALQPGCTPTDAFYVRSNFAVPDLPSDGWRLRVEGAVQQRLELSLADLMQLPAHTVTSTMECAGNNRLALAPLPKGEPWGAGAVSTGEWQGVSLPLLLERSGINASAVELLFKGADGGKVESGPEPVPFARSLPVGKALDPDTMLAYRLNGDLLPPAHGGPLRLLVPDWYGMASVKWLVRITALTEPFAGFFQAERYVYDRPDEAITPVREMLVKSLITSPAAGLNLSLGWQMVQGLAWSGAGPITAVEVSVDGAGAWQPARLVGAANPHTWQAWEFDWNADRSGRHVLRCRAYDAAGNVQPDVPLWNRLGYGNNAVQLRVVEVSEQ